jgi:hypothetical protein
VERRTEFSEIDIIVQFFSTGETQGANGRFQVRDRDGAITEIGAKRTRLWICDPATLLNVIAASSDLTVKQRGVWVRILAA